MRGASVLTPEEETGRLRTTKSLGMSRLASLHRPPSPNQAVQPAPYRTQSQGKFQVHAGRPATHPPCQPTHTNMRRMAMAWLRLITAASVITSEP